MNLLPAREFQWLVRQVRPFVWAHVASLLFILLSSLMNLLDPLIVKWLIDDVVPGRRWRLLPVAAASFFAAYVARLVCQWLGRYVTFGAVQKMVFKIRIEVLRHLQRLSAEYHERTPVGETQFRLQQDVDQVGDLGGDILPGSLTMILVTLSVLGAMAVLDWRLACMILPLVPVFLVQRSRFGARLRASADAVQQRSGNLNSSLQESLSAVVEIQLLGREKRQTRQFARLSGQLVRAQLKRRLAELRFALGSMLVFAAGTALILAFGGYQVMRGSLTVGGLVAFYGYLGRLFEPLSGAVEMYSRFQRVGASIRRLLGVLDYESRVRSAPGAAPLPEAAPAWIEMRDVAFAYEADRDVLRDLHLKVEAGEKVALVGASGSGKSSVAKLVARLYDPSHGTVSVNGADLRGVDLGSLRAQISFVPQDSIVFAASLRDNLLWGNPRASQADLDAAAAVAQLRAVIEKQPGGWDQPLGPFGGGLSRGERQRLALARALVQDRPILILDEATSALDAATEDAILQALHTRCRDKTVLLITHRPAGARWADRIFVLAAGRLVEKGAYAQLHQAGTEYYRLCQEGQVGHKNPPTAPTATVRPTAAVRLSPAASRSA